MISIRIVETDEGRCISAVLVVNDSTSYFLDSLGEIAQEDNETELEKLRDFVSLWTSHAEAVRLPISIDKEVDQYGIEVAMEVTA